MKGIIVKSHVAGKDDITKVAIPNGIATAALTISCNDEVIWGIGAMTMPEGKSLSWNGGSMNVGDIICLKFTDIDKPSQPLSHEFVDACMKGVPEEDGGEHQSSDTREWDFKLGRYYRLKAFLENEHVI